MFKYTCILLGLFYFGIATGQKAVSSEIQNLKSAGIDFTKVEILKFQTTDIQNREFNLQGLAKGTIISLDQEAIDGLYKDQPDFVSISVPTAERTDFVLALKRHEIFAPDFKLFTSSDSAIAIEYTPGLHYMGIVEGDPTSIVGLSVFRDQVMAMIATDEGNLVIGRIKGDTENRHILYNDRDLDEDFPIECATEDEGLEYTEEQLSAVQNSRDLNDCVRIYIEINDDIVTNKGGAVPATDYITAIFNQSFVIYTNEQLSLTICEIMAWTTPSPYTGANSSGMLNSYKANTEFFNGDLSHLISFDSLYGGVAAGFSGICNANPDLSKCFSGIRYNYENVPVFSMPVFLVTHEMGHLLGSRHTHACVWNGNNTAIDGCALTVEGSCPLPGVPPNGGTIMSYCAHSNSGSFVDFNLGFGPQPGNVIRNTVNAAGNCLSPCGQPTQYCSSNGTNSSSEFIDKVVINTINNLSGNNGGYGNFTALTTNLNAGNSYTITLTPKFTGGNKIKSWRVWIDYNHDFDWYDAGECVGQGAGNNTLSISFTVPASISSVTTRMRVSMKYTGYPGFCGTFPVGEVEDYTVMVIAPTPTCSDDIQNQGEAGIDCGGPCPACPTCSDAIQNQNETGVDCGGPCPACPVGDSTVLLGSYFESGWDSWIDGGNDVARVSTTNAWEGQYAIELSDNSNAQSSITSPVFNLSDAVGLQITFHFKAVSMETGEDFWVQYKNGSGAWTTVGNFVAGSNFNNNAYYAATVTVPNFVPTSAGSLRIQCDASDNNDQVFIDAVTIVKLNGTELIESGVTLQQILKPTAIPAEDIQAEADKELIVYPNPAHDLLNISFDGDIQSVRVVSLDGKGVSLSEVNQIRTLIDISQLANGFYFLLVQSDGRWYPAKFTRM